MMSAKSRSDVLAAKVVVRKARMTDAKGIRELIAFHAQENKMLPRSWRYIYENLRDFYVGVDEEGAVVACGALHISWEDLAEIKAVAVRADLMGRGLGRKVVQACIDEASGLDIPRIFVLTFTPEFFKKLGFAEIDKNELPHKVWSECVDCPLFPDCGEIALATDVKGPEKRKT